MNRQELREFAALHALDLLDGEERKRFEKELQSNPEVARLLGEYQEAADLIAVTAEQRQPPAELEERIFESLPEQDRRLDGLDPETEIPNDGGNTDGASATDGVVNAWIPWGIAAALAVTCGAIWIDRSEKLDRIESQANDLSTQLVRISEQESEVSELRRQIAEQSERLDAQLSQIEEQNEQLGDQSERIQRQLAQIEERDERILDLEQKGALDNLRIAVLKSQLESMPSAEAVAVWDAGTQQGRLSVSNLPSVPPGKEYQLWLINSEVGSPISAGVFNTDATGRTQYTFAGSSDVDRVDTFALSVEDEGGKPAPEGPIVLVGE